MTSRWFAAAAASLALSLLTLPLLTSCKPSGGGDRSAAASAVPAGAEGRPQTCDATGTAKLDFVVKDMYNVPTRLTDYKGKVVLLNFWATWCEPCKAEIPSFVQLYDQYKSKGLVIVGVSIDDSPARMQPFAREWHMQYPLLQMLPALEDEYGPFYGIPTTYLIGRDGSICTKHLGPASKQQFEQEIKALL